MAQASRLGVQARGLCHLLIQPDGAGDDDRDDAHTPNWANEYTRRPVITPANTPDAIEHTIVYLREALFHNGNDCGAPAIKQALTQKGIEPVPSLRTIYRILHRYEKEVKDSTTTR